MNLLHEISYQYQINIKITKHITYYREFIVPFHSRRTYQEFQESVCPVYGAIVQIPSKNENEKKTRKKGKMEE